MACEACVQAEPPHGLGAGGGPCAQLLLVCSSLRGTLWAQTLWPGDSRVYRLTPHKQPATLACSKEGWAAVATGARLLPRAWTSTPLSGANPCSE